jgi:FkbM family methyltransferase
MNIIIKLILILQDFHQRRIYRYLSRYENKIRCIFDVGSHEGEFVKHFKNNKIIFYLFEPNQNKFLYLKKKFKKKVYNIFNFGLGYIEIKKKFYLSDLSHTSGFLKPKKKNLFNKIKFFLISKKNNKYNYVNLKRLDKFIYRRKIKKIDILKIDTEGYELNVLKGAGKLIRNNKISKILIEKHRFLIYKNNNYKKILDYLKNNNYKQEKKFGFLTYEDILFTCGNNS